MGNEWGHIGSIRWSEINDDKIHTLRQPPRQPKAVEILYDSGITRSFLESEEFRSRDEPKYADELG